MVFDCPVRGLAAFAGSKFCVVKYLTSFRLRKSCVFEGSKWILKKRRTRCVLGVSMQTDGLGAGRRSRKPRPVRRFERLGEPMVSEISWFTRFLKVKGSAPVFRRRKSAKT